MAVKILAADDSATMRKVLEMTFAGESVEIETVDSGEAAVERASQSTPDLVIADASMSMNGYEVSRALKQNPATANVAVVVLASQHTPFDAAKASDCGVDDHVLKPYDSQAMIDKAKEVLSRPRAKATGAAAAPIAAAPPRPPAPPARPAAPAAPVVTAPARPASASPSPRSTVAFGAMAPKPGERPALQLAEEEPAPARPAVPAAPKRPVPVAPVAPAVTAPVSRTATPSPAVASPAAPAARAAAATSSGGDMAGKLAGLGLTPEQVEGVLGLSREVIERVVWEVVPDLAEVIIREEIKRLTAD